MLAYDGCNFIGHTSSCISLHKCVIQYCAQRWVKPNIWVTSITEVVHTGGGCSVGRSVDHDRCPLWSLHMVGIMVARCVVCGRSGVAKCSPKFGYDNLSFLLQKTLWIFFVTLLYYYLLYHILFLKYLITLVVCGTYAVHYRASISQCSCFSWDFPRDFPVWLFKVYLCLWCQLNCSSLVFSSKFCFNLWTSVCVCPSVWLLLDPFAFA